MYLLVRKMAKTHPASWTTSEPRTQPSQPSNSSLACQHEGFKIHVMTEDVKLRSSGSPLPLITDQSVIPPTRPVGQLHCCAKNENSHRNNR